MDDRTLTDAESAVVVYDNPYDNIRPMAHHFLGRCLEAGVVPCVVSKHTVFKWQHAFFRIMKEVYDQHYKSKFLER
ncbi:hypothetical protein NL529_28475, partial [Klebsiella pneumoniae]|nr:hypothetical protein [Klebsiella pneumoniae]